MDIGVVLQTDPPAARVVELARQAKMYVFSHAWTFDSHLLWQVPFVVYRQILAATRKIIVGPMVRDCVQRGESVIPGLRPPQQAKLS